MTALTGGRRSSLVSTRARWNTCCLYRPSSGCNGTSGRCWAYWNCARWDAITLVSILEILNRLIEHDVEFVLIGGLAGALFGSSIVTQDVDIAAPLTEQNVVKILAAVADVHPAHRMTAPTKALTETPAELARFKNLYLITDLGQLDIIGEVAGVGAYPDARRESVEISLHGRAIRTLSLAALIRSKLALNREKDRVAVVELKALLERLGGSRDG